MQKKNDDDKLQLRTGGALERLAAIQSDAQLDPIPDPTADTFTALAWAPARVTTACLSSLLKAAWGVSTWASAKTANSIAK